VKKRKPKVVKSFNLFKKSKDEPTRLFGEICPRSVSFVWEIFLALEAKEFDFECGLTVKTISSEYIKRKFDELVVSSRRIIKKLPKSSPDPQLCACRKTIISIKK
jgi:hypothetical protein